MCWHKWVWQEPEKEIWSTHIHGVKISGTEHVRTAQKAKCSKCGKVKIIYL